MVSSVTTVYCNCIVFFQAYLSFKKYVLFPTVSLFGDELDRLVGYVNFSVAAKGYFLEHIKLLCLFFYCSVQLQNLQKQKKPVIH